MKPRQLALLSGSAILVAAGLLLTIHNAQQSHPWTQEPKTFLGVTLGQPLKASIPLCVSKAIAGTEPLCAKSYDDFADIENEPGGVGLVTAHQVQGLVSSVEVIQAADSYALTEHDLIERYGRPTSTSGDTDIWEGKLIDINLSKVSRDRPAVLLSAYLNSAVGSQSPTHHNPF